VQHTTPAIDSLLASFDTAAQDTARANARAMFDEAPDASTPAPVLDLAKSSPAHRYSAWVRLEARKQRAEAITQRELAWSASYQGSKEFESWHELHEGVDPMEGSATG
jgi:hypothetical protein